MDTIEKEMKDYLCNVVSSFSPGINYACAYGSGVFKQQGHVSMKDNMIDFIFVVDNALSWHQQTLNKYSNHYSFMKSFGANVIANCQTEYGAGVYFNTCVEFNGRLIKYGVIDIETFKADLNHWNDLYIAGRLQKPVLTLTGFESPDIDSAFSNNLKSAVLTSLFMLPEKCSIEDLFMKIASLSYTGDPRMVVGEDKGKVRNIVVPNLDKFMALYNPILQKMPNIAVQNMHIEQDLSDDVSFDNFCMLPGNLHRLVCKRLNLEHQKEEVVRKRFLALSKNEVLDAVSKSTAQIVRKSSTTQTVKNSVTAGFTKSFYYSGEKLKKMFRGLIRK